MKLNALQDSVCILSQIKKEKKLIVCFLRDDVIGSNSTYFVLQAVSVCVCVGGEGYLKAFSYAFVVHAIAI